MVTQMTNLAIVNNANTIATVDSTVQINVDLLTMVRNARENWTRIKRADLELMLPMYKQVGDTIQAIHDMTSKRKERKELLDMAGLGDMERQEKSYILKYAEICEQVESVGGLREQGIINGRSPQTIVRQYDKWLKSTTIEHGSDDVVDTTNEEGDTDAGVESLEKIMADAVARAEKNGYTKEQMIAMLNNMA